MYKIWSWASQRDQALQASFHHDLCLNCSLSLLSLVPALSSISDGLWPQSVSLLDPHHGDLGYMYFILLLLFAIIITVTKNKLERGWNLFHCYLLLPWPMVNFSSRVICGGMEDWYFLTGTSEVPVFSIKVKSSVGKENNGCHPST